MMNGLTNASFYLNNAEHLNEVYDELKALADEIVEDEHSPLEYRIIIYTNDCDYHIESPYYLNGDTDWEQYPDDSKKIMSVTILTKTIK